MDKQRLAHRYEQLEILEKSGVVGDAYEGTMHLDIDVDWEVIFSFYEYITEVYEELPDWANAFIQIYSWQYQNFYIDVLKRNRKQLEDKKYDRSKSGQS